MILQKQEQHKRLFSHTQEVCHLLAPLYAVFIPIISLLSLKDLCGTFSLFCLAWCFNSFWLLLFLTSNFDLYTNHSLMG
jgi:hypothetical protein